MGGNTKFEFTRNLILHIDIISWIFKFQLLLNISNIFLFQLAMRTETEFVNFASK